MPASAASLALTDSYRDRLLALRTGVVRMIRASWATLTLDDLDASYRQWLAAASSAVAGAQMSGVTLADAYLAAYIGSETGAAATPTGLDVDEFAGRDQFDRPLEESLTPPLYTVKAAVADRHGTEAAFALGLERAVRVAAAATVAAPQQALAAGIETRPEIVGWRRATSRNPCGGCLAAATGAIHDTAIVLDAHTHCRCTKEPVVRGVRERHHRPTGPELWESMTVREQDALFHGRGGAEKAELLRAGDITFDDLITRQEMALGGQVITETPLAALA